MLGAPTKMDVLALCAVLVASNVAVEAMNDFAVPFEVKNGESVYGDTRRANVDDQVAEVTFTQAFPFGDQAFKKFYVSKFNSCCI